MSHLDDVTQQALKLDIQERARLAERLLKSLDGLSDTEIEQIWFDEADRRIREYREGRMSAVPADQALQEVRDLLK